jgi:radical SAM protein with 4Fe4S-binding SPASM domain
MRDIKSFYQVECSHKRRILKRLSGPINLNLIVTKRCNADCIHCCASANENKEELSLKNLKKIIYIAKKNKIFYFVITGGEPFKYKHIWKLLKLLNNKFGIIINTNGTLISEKIAKRLSKYNIADIHVSLDAPNNKIYSKQRGNSTEFLDVLNGIENLIKNNLKITAKLIITKINKDCLEDVTKLAISKGIKKIKFAWFKSVGRGRLNEKNLELNKLEIKKIVEKLYSLKENYKEKIEILFDNSQCFPFLFKKTKDIRYRKICGDYFCRIDANGDMFPCPFLDIKIGNIFNKSLSELWEDATLLELRRLSWGKNLSGECKKCRHNRICSGGCRANAINAYKKINAKDPYCWTEHDK